MEENLFITYVSCFKNLQQEHKQLQDFVHGTTNRILSKSRSELDYPCLWLETPNFKVKDNGAGGITAGHFGAFVVMKNASADDGNSLSQDQEDQIWAETHSITMDVLSRLKEDERESGLRIDFNTVSIDPISTITADKDYGWRVEFSLEKELEICYDESKWN